MYAQPKTSKVMPLFGVPSHTRKLGDEEILQIIGWVLLKTNFRRFPIFRKVQEGLLSHVDLPSMLVASLGIVLGSDGVRQRIPSQSRLFEGNCRVELAVERAACHRK